MNIKELFNEVKNKRKINYFNFEDNYNYFIYETKEFYFYIENSNNHFLYDLGETTATCYLKIDYNTKIQYMLPTTIECSHDLFIYYLKALENYHVKEFKKGLKGCKEQKLNFDFVKSKKPDEKEYNSIFDKMNLGFREKEIIKNITSIEMLYNTKDYKVYRVWNNENYFEFNYLTKIITG